MSKPLNRASRSTGHTWTTRLLAVVAMATAVAASATAGPEDQFTKFPIGVAIPGGSQVAGIFDPGGTTTISFEDAKKLGFLDANGDPAEEPDDSQRLGGTGGGSVDCYVFRGAWIRIQPLKPDGSPNGAPRDIKVTIFVPKKPALQNGDNAQRERATKSVPTKLGANVAGAVVQGKKIGMTDAPTNDPRKNLRGTEWLDVAAGGGGGGGGQHADRSAPAVHDDNYEDGNVQYSVLPDVRINGVQCGGLMSGSPVTCLGAESAQIFNAQPIEQIRLDFEDQATLFEMGAIDVVPDPENLLVLPVALIDVEVPTLERQPMIITGVRAFILPQQQGFDPYAVVLGGNALVPPDTQSWLDDATQTINWILTPPYCPGDYNQDGRVDTIDFISFLNDWNAHDQGADWNADGRFDTLDFIAFLNDWTGCS